MLSATTGERGHTKRPTVRMGATRSAVTRLSTYRLPGSAWALWTKGVKPKQTATLMGPPGISSEACLMRRVIAWKCSGYSGQGARVAMQFL